MSASSILNQIIEYLGSPPAVILNQQETQAYVIAFLFPRNEATVIDVLNSAADQSFRLSNYTLYECVKQLVEVRILVVSRTENVGRGKPRNVYALNPQYRDSARIVRDLWQRFAQTLD